MDYEIVIPAASKDFNKIPYLIQSAKEFLWPQPIKINIIHDGKGDVNEHLSGCDFPAISIIHEKNVLPFDPNAAKGFHRSPWIYQQFLKLFQDITETNYYLVLDSDLIINKDIQLFDEDERPYFFLGIDQYHRPYFNYSTYMLGIDREYDYSFISEIMMFRKDITKTMTHYFDIYQQTQHRLIYPSIGFNRTHSQRVKIMYDWTCDLANNNFIPADYELYGNFVEKIDRHMYVKKHIKSNLKGMYRNWTNEEMESYIKEMRKLDEHDMFTAHTWL